MMALRIFPMDRAAAVVIAGWRYPPPYDFYNIEDEPLELASFFTHLDSGYYRIVAGGELVGFCCFGEEAQVPGGDYTAPALDFGLGVRPDLTGRGEGRRYLDAVLDFARAQFNPPALRLSVAAFNQRAIRLYTTAGFIEVQRFSTTFSGREFIVMMRPT